MTLICIVFFVNSLLALEPRRLWDLPVDGLLAALPLATAVYTGLLVAVTLGFAHLIRASGHARGRSLDALAVWGKANLAKYLPGNVFHFAGRQILGGRRGWPQPCVAAATLLELALQVALPCLIAAGVLLSIGRLDMLGRLGQSVWALPLLLTLAVAVAVMAFLVFFGCVIRHPWSKHLARPLAKLNLARPVELCPAILYQGAFFAGMTLIVIALYGLVEGALYVDEVPYLVAAFLASWVLGLVVPGAPGGIGVREGSFALLGGVFLVWDSLVLVALLMRFVTLAGEGLLFLLATWLDDIEHQAPAENASTGTARWNRQALLSRAMARRR